jgi:hypothetical protein
MPYIKATDRLTLLHITKALSDFNISRSLTAGELNYLITNCVNSYLTGRNQSYEAYNTVIGALECAKLEVYRRKIADYEDIKIQENGDVF